MSYLLKDDISSRNSQMDVEFAFAHKTVISFSGAQSKPDSITAKSLLPGNLTPTRSPHMNKSYEKTIYEGNKANDNDGEATKPTAPELRTIFGDIRLIGAFKQGCDELEAIHVVAFTGFRFLMLDTDGYCGESPAMLSFVELCSDGEADVQRY
ncbi:hypothetical protein EGR_11081 [Echinococcus granulosus]|uniref:Uncharacterized protein n=1 Tax=Echinococcus granulosus TaxID=6210 RepID=W6TZ31_ECHGR|nr:hypothetical protein EGR_11081 [Echinococcus granulosus]EUB54060.1 hypothetical protein EGR_11081 [Echinococcus granulosus]